MIDKKITIIILSVLLLLPLTSFLVSANLLEEVLAPFETTDFSVIYDSYYSIIDFIIYTILFVGLSQVSLGKHFDSRGGKSVVVAIGLVLAIALTISESVLGFNLRSFGPLAATIFIFLIGLVIYLGIKSAGMESVGAISIALVLTYFSIRSVSPGFFDWMINNEYLAWLHSVILIAVLISIYKLSRLFFGKKNNAKDPIEKKFLKDAFSIPVEKIKQYKEEKNELAFIKSKLEVITNESGKDSKQIINDLQELKKIIAEFSNSSKGRSIISQKVESILTQEKQIHHKFEILREMISKVSSFDINQFKNVQEQYDKLPQDQKNKLNHQIKIEWKKLNAEKQIVKLEEAIFIYDKLFRHHLDILISSLNANKIKESVKQIDEAISTEKNDDGYLSPQIEQYFSTGKLELMKLYLGLHVCSEEERRMQLLSSLQK